jgi:LPS sulfotransferase NodH
VSVVRRSRAALRDPIDVGRRTIATASDEVALMRHRLRLRWLSASMPPMGDDPVFVLTTARSGSNLLRSLLNDLPGVTIANEVLHPRTYVGARRLRTPDAGLAHLQRSLTALDGDVRGAKLFFSHLERLGLDLPRIIATYPRARWIVLYRESLWAQFLSTQRALRSGEWVHQVREDSFERHQVRVPNRFKGAEDTFQVEADVLERYLRQQRAWYDGAVRELQRSSRAALVAYEDLVADHDAVLHSLTEDLDLPASERTVRQGTRKQAGTSDDALVENLDELRDLLASDLAHLHLAWRTQ